MRKSIRATRFLTLALALPALASLPGCTDLDEVPTSAISPQNFYRNEAEVLGGLASVYAQMRATNWSYYNLSQVSSDETIVPTRGSDWYDNGRWLEIDEQSWEANSPAGLEDVGGAWNDLFTGIARANVVINALKNITLPDPATQATVEAELRTLRAFYYYMLMDLFGGVPIDTTGDIARRPRATRTEVFTFIENQLTAALADLPDSWPSTSHGRLTKGAAYAILASMYLNAEVFTGDVTTAGLTKGTARWQDAIDAVDDLLALGEYSLATNYRSSFTADNNTSPENILVVKFANQPDLGLNLVMRALHYNQFNPSPWNGFSTIAEVYNAFDANDVRRQIFLVGQQVNQDPLSPSYLQPVNDRQGNPLVYTTTIADVNAATEAEGARILKWPPDPNHVAQDNGNDFAYFRLGEMYLIQAEAMNELGQTNQAIQLINNTTRGRGNPGKLLPLGLSQAAARDSILAERMFELAGETKRRTDLIRHGKYTSMTWLNKGVTDPFRILMPIPQSQIDVSFDPATGQSVLTQNPGY